MKYRECYLYVDEQGFQHFYDNVYAFNTLKLGEPQYKFIDYLAYQELIELVRTRVIGGSPSWDEFKKDFESLTGEKLSG